MPRVSFVKYRARPEAVPYTRTRVSGLAFPNLPRKCATFLGLIGHAGNLDVKKDVDKDR